MPLAVVGVATDANNSTGDTLVLPTITGPSKGLAVVGKNIGSSVITPPSGWTVVDNQTPGTTLDADLYQADLDVVNSGQSIFFALSGSPKNAAACIVVSGANATLDGFTAASDNANTNTAVTHPAYTPTASGVLLVALIQGQHATAATTYTPDADYTAQASVIGGYATPVQSSRISTRQITGGAGTPVTGDAGTWGANSREVVWVVGLAPATGGTAAIATGAITLGGSPAAQAPATAVGSLTLGGTPAAVAPVVATGSIALGGSSAATAPTTVAGTVTLSGLATSPGSTPATATGAITLSGVPVARAAVVSVGTITLGGATTSTAPVAVAGTISLSGAPVARAATLTTGLITLGGTSPATGAATVGGLVTLAGAVTARAAATALGSITLSGSATSSLQSTPGAMFPHDAPTATLRPLTTVGAGMSPRAGSGAQMAGKAASGSTMKGA